MNTRPVLARTARLMLALCLIAMTVWVLSEFFKNL